MLCLALRQGDILNPFLLVDRAIHNPFARAWLQEKASTDVWTTPGGHRRIRASALKKLTDSRCGVQPHDVTATTQEISATEKARLAAVDRSGLVHSIASTELQRLVWLAAEITCSSSDLIGQ